VRFWINAITASRLHNANGSSIWSGHDPRIDRTIERSTDASFTKRCSPTFGPRFCAASDRDPSARTRSTHAATDCRHTPKVRAASDGLILSSITA
jgi:hypothetical protein